MRNLNERLRIEKLKEELHKVFDSFGSCIIVAMRGIRRKGQAWIIYESIQSSQDAMTELQGQLFHGKKLDIAFSSNHSHVTLLRKGLQVKRSVSDNSNIVEPKRSKPLPVVDSFFSHERQTVELSDARSSAKQSYNRPNKILLVENLPENFGIADLEPLFSVYAGFVEVRPIPGRGMAFVEFSDDHRSQVALNKLNGYQLSDGRRMIVNNCKS